MKKLLEGQLHQIAKITKERYSTIEHIGVLGGRAGISLFLFYCAKYFNEDSYSNIGLDILESCIDSINDNYIFSTYTSGLAGFGWAVQHLFDNDFIDLDMDELLVPMESYLESQMEKDLSNGYYDFMHGALGYGFYFLKRYYGTRNRKLKQKYCAILTNLINSLTKISEVQDDRIRWQSVLDIRKGNKGYNLSLSHGMSSIINFLTRVGNLSDLEIDSKKLLNGACKYVLSFENEENNDSKSIFPSWIENDCDIEYNSRLAWCYGDLGIGLSLLKAGKFLENKKMAERAIDILEKSSNRKIATNTRVVDAGICHGSYGNSIIFNEIQKEYPLFSIKQATDFWAKDGYLKSTQDSKEPYRQWTGSEDGWQFELNILEGISGIGLSIIDYLSDENNNWSECLLLH